MANKKEKPAKNMEPLKAMGHSFNELFQETAKSLDEAAKNTSGRIPKIQAFKREGFSSTARQSSVDVSADSSTARQSSADTSPDITADSSADTSTASSTGSSSASSTGSSTGGVLVLSKSQRSLLRALMDQKIQGAGGIRSFCIADFSRTSGIPDPTLRSALSTLSKYGLFIHRKQANLGAKRFIEYSLYEELAEALISSVATFKKIRDHQLVHQAVHQAVHQLPHQAFPISSKFLNQTTTKTGQEGSDNLEAILKRPEMRYWTTHPNILTARQLATWMDEFGLNAETLAMYLDYCRFDMIENGKEKKVETNPINYFYGTVRNTGHYKIPENYLTLEQLRTREAEEVLKRKQEANRKLEETLRLSKLEDLRAEFLVIYNNPESEEYKNLLGGSKTGQFVENQEIIKADMWAAFQKEHGFEPKEAKNND